MKKIKIIFDVSILANGVKKTSGRSGIFFVAYNILRELIKRKNVLITFYIQDKYSSAINFIRQDPLLKNLKFYNSSFLKRLSIYCSSLRVKRKETNYLINKFIINLARGALSILLRLLSKFYKNNKNKLLNFDIFFSPVFAIPNNIRKNNKIKRFTISYDMIPFIFPEYYPDVQAGNSWFLTLMESLDKDDYFFTISDFSKHDLIKYNKNIDPNKIVTTYLAASDNFYQCKDKNKINQVLTKYKIPENIKYVFSLCTLEPRKNLVHAIKCFVQTIEKYKIDDLYFILGGGHWDIFIEKLEKEIANFDKYRNKILKIGYVNDEDLAPLYSGSMFFVYPSLYEGFGLPPLEAMKCGTPVITLNTSSLPEVVGDAGIMVDPESEEQLINAMYKLYKDKALRKELSKKGLERAKMFSWERMVDEIMKKFKEICRHD
jgi:glycosyltransferase involved in cell wall biosynthesis